jgi:hypothetical protein
MFEYVVVAAAIASLLGSFAYIRSMFRGGVKPNRITWFMWSVAPFIAVAASISNGASWAVVPVLMSGISPLLIFAASFFHKEAYWKLSKFDYLCGVLSALALVLWYLTKDPNLTIAFAIISDALAAAPTLTKAWRCPESESSWPYVIGTFSPLTSFLVASSFTFAQVAFPSYLVLVNLLLVLSVHLKKGLSRLFRKK